MSIEKLSVAGYRSIVDLEITLDRLNVIAGPNGSGKSNLYRSLHLLTEAAQGRLAEAILAEGGMESALWAGPRLKGPRRMSLGIRLGPFDYALQLGLVATSPEDPTVFRLDPDIKEERFYFHDRTSRVELLHRKNRVMWMRDEEGNRTTYADELFGSQSAVSTISDPRRFPDLLILRQELSSPRFYHDFPTGPDSPGRRSQLAMRSFVLHPYGNNLASTLQSIFEAGMGPFVEQAMDRLVPGGELIIRRDDRSQLSIEIEQPGLSRPLAATELSDGMLRYLYLMAVLLSPRPAPLVALNEPERSLHPDMIEPLADLLWQASGESQIWLVTHSQKLRDSLIGRPGVATFDLKLHRGRTQCAASTRNFSGH